MCGKDQQELARLFRGLLTMEVSLVEFADAGMAELDYDLPPDLRFPVMPEHVAGVVRAVQDGRIPRRAAMNWGMTLSAFDEVYEPDDSDSSRRAWAVIRALWDLINAKDEDAAWSGVLADVERMMSAEPFPPTT